MLQPEGMATRKDRVLCVFKYISLVSTEACQALKSSLDQADILLSPVACTLWFLQEQSCDCTALSNQCVLCHAVKALQGCHVVRAQWPTAYCHCSLLFAFRCVE